MPKITENTHLNRKKNKNSLLKVVHKLEKVSKLYVNKNIYIYTHIKRYRRAKQECTYINIWHSMSSVTHKVSIRGA